jgi:hypothetical protein
MSYNNRPSIIAFILISLLCLADICALRQLIAQNPTIFSTSARLRIPLVQQSPRGIAVLQWNPKNDELWVTITVTELVPASIHRISLFTDTCIHTGQVVSSLNPLVANAHGVGSSQTIMHSVANGIPLTGWAIKISNGSTLATGLAARSILCGNVSGVHMIARGTQSAHVLLMSTLSPNESVHGLAQIRAMGAFIIVTLSLSGLAPKTTHMASLHTGSCTFHGPVLYRLQPVFADVQGNAMTTTTLNVHALTTIHISIKVHEAGTLTALKTPQGFSSIACGDVKNRL